MIGWFLKPAMFPIRKGSLLTVCSLSFLSFRICQAWIDRYYLISFFFFLAQLSCSLAPVLLQLNSKHCCWHSELSAKAAGVKVYFSSGNTWRTLLPFVALCFFYCTFTWPSLSVFSVSLQSLKSNFSVPFLSCVLLREKLLRAHIFRPEIMISDRPTQ